MRTAETRSTGRGDAIFLAAWRFVRRDRPIATFRMSTEIGLKAPTGADDLTDPDGERLPSLAQRGSGSWDPIADVNLTYVPVAGRGRWTFGSDVGLSWTTEANGIEVGNHVSYNGMVKYRVHPRRHPGRDTYVLLKLNGRWRNRTGMGDLVVEASGGHVIY